MNKIIAINGSPRKNANTAMLLQSALEGAAVAGADTQLVHLVDLKYSGCMSCFACKLKGTKFIGSCAIRDDLTPVLETAMQSSAIILGSPIYLGDVTALMRAFIERFGFMNTSYDNKSYSNFTGKINGAFFYTMNLPAPVSRMFSYVYAMNTGRLRRLNGRTYQLLATDTYQFDDYSKYAASNFNADSKRASREKRFQADIKKARVIGQKLATQ